MALDNQTPFGKKNCLWGHWKRNLGFEGGGFPGGFGHHFCRCSCYLLNANIKNKIKKQQKSEYFDWRFRHTHIHCNEEQRYLSVTLTTVWCPDSSLLPLLPFCATTMINLLLHEKSRLFCEHLCRSLISSRLALTHCIVLQ